MIWKNQNALSHGKGSPGINTSVEWSYVTATLVPSTPVQGQSGKDLAEG